MPRVLIAASPALVSELNRTILWRSDIERIVAPRAQGLPALVKSMEPALLILGDEDSEATLRTLREIRANPEIRRVSVAVLRHAVTLETETELREAGANVVFGGEVVPYLWDAWLEELLAVPRRREARVPVRFEVWSHTSPADEATEGLAVNVSVKGMLLETEEVMDIGSKLDMTFRLPGDTQDLRVVGQVVREAAAPEGRPRAGVEFLILRDTARDRVRAFVEDRGR